jgi:trehalose-6-phosphatase
VIGLDWKNLVEPVMKHYTDVTDGSYIEAKETALVWHYEEADPDFGSCQAKDLQDHLLSVLAKEPVCVKSGHKIVEVNPQVRKHLISRASFLHSYCYATLHHSGKGITILSWSAPALWVAISLSGMHRPRRKEQVSKFHR